MNMQLQKEKSWIQGTLSSRFALTKPESSKKAFHVILCFPEPLTYLPGDSIAILPKNSRHLIQELLRHLPFGPEEQVTCKKTGQKVSFYDFLREHANLRRVSQKLHQAFDSSKTTSFLGEVLDLVRAYPHCKIPVQEFVDLLLPITPRFYSIASSPSLYPHEVHLTVGLAQYEVNAEARYGAASYFLCHELEKGESLSAFIHTSPHFRLPEDPGKHLIMIGPGTGIAPFRSFLQDRIANDAPGEHWLFFGERNRRFDFYYENEWDILCLQKKLRLETAFSRDQKERIYVQHLLKKHADELNSWIQNGAYIYLCGDAKKMAKDVISTLKEIFQEKRALSSEGALSYWQSLKKEGRIRLDIY